MNLYSQNGQDIAEQLPQEKQSDGRSSAFEYFSASIELLRFPLIVLVVLIHSRFQGPDYPDSFTEFLCNSVLFGKMPHCAVGAFFVISGYLFAHKAVQSGAVQRNLFSMYPEILRRKFKSLVIPYLLWNTLLMLPHLLVSLCHISSSLLPASKYADMNIVQILVRTYGLGLRVVPIDVPLWFVRSLILLFLVSPVILFLIRFLPKYISLILLIAGMLLLENSSLLFFAFGIFFGCFDLDMRPLKKWWYLFLLSLPAYCFFADCYPYVWFILGPNLFLLTVNCLFYLFLIALAELMSRLPERMRKVLVLAGGYSFWIYCAHAPFATTITRVGLRFHCLGMPPLLWMILSCVAAIAISLGVFFPLRIIAPRAAALLCGGRLPKQDPILPIYNEEK